MKLLALDQATKLTGVSIWDDKELIDHFVVDTNVSENNPFLRMNRLKKEIVNIIEKYKPDALCLEGVQFQRNYNTYMQLGQLQGVIFGICFDYNLPFKIVSASSWRHYLGISGQKREVYKANTIKYVNDKYDFTCTDDEADAICVGLWGIDQKYE